MVVFELLYLQVLVPRQLALVCHSVDMEWGVKYNHVAVIALHNCRKTYSQISKLLKPLKISRMFIYRAIKHYKELGRVEDRARSGRLKCVRPEAAIKTVQERIRRNPLWKQKILSRKLNISIQSRRASSGTIYTRERTSAQRDTSLLLLWRRSDGQEQNVSPSGTPRTATKISSSRRRTFSPSKSSITNRTTRFMLKRPLRCVLRVQVGHWPSYVMVWWEVDHQGVTQLYFCKKGVKLVSEYIKRTCYKKLWNILTWLSSVVRNGSSSRSQSLVKRPRQLRSGCGGTFWTSSAPRICFRWVQTSKHWTINCGLFWGTWNAESVRVAWRAWGDYLWRQRQRSPWRLSVRRQQSGRSVSRLAKRHRAAILSDIVIN